MVPLKYLNVFLLHVVKYVYWSRSHNVSKKNGMIFHSMEPIHGALNWNIDVIIRALYESLKGKGVQTSFFKMQVKSKCQHCVDVYVQSLKSDAITSRDLVVNIFYI